MFGQTDCKWPERQWCVYERARPRIYPPYPGMEGHDGNPIVTSRKSTTHQTCNINTSNLGNLWQYYTLQTTNVHKLPQGEPTYLLVKNSCTLEHLHMSTPTHQSAEPKWGYRRPSPIVLWAMLMPHSDASKWWTFWHALIRLPFLQTCSRFILLTLKHHETLTIVILSHSCKVHCSASRCREIWQRS